jgi:glucose/arabinose dehydrogenase
VRLIRPIVLATLLAVACSANAPSPSPEDTDPPVATPNESATPGPDVASLDHWGDFEQPVALRAPKGSDDYFVVTKKGQIWRTNGSDRDLMLDLADEISTEAEQGLYDIVVSPDGKYAYVHFTGREKPYGDNHIWEYRWNGAEVVGEPREVLVVEDPYPHHNGGQLEFGPDGHLYIGIGDGGTDTLSQDPNNGDPHGNGQSTDDLLGNVLRIDPRPDGDEPYGIPDDNPFAASEAGDREEIWAYGLRNPWRFSFDSETGDLWLPDVGHQRQEEINFQKAGSSGGHNYGWSLREGPLAYKGDPPKDNVLPVYAYPHRGGPCAIIGGYVYRGKDIPSLRGSYVFGDFCTGVLQAIRLRDGNVTGPTQVAKAPAPLMSLGRDRDGELFALTLNDGIFRLRPRDE